MDRQKIFTTADRLTAYAIERQAGMERHLPPGAPPKTEQKQEQPKANKTGTSCGIRPAARAASFPPFISASVPALLYPFCQSFMGRFFAFVL